MISKLEDVAKQGTEVYIDLVELCDTIPLLNWMISENRPYAKDLERDKDNKIVVDIARPHIIEDIDYFRQAAIAFKKYGKYTDYYPSPSPSSPYKKFWDEEIRRCKEGYVRKSDGEWVTGYHYFYLNYSPILKTEIIGERTEDGSVQADRVSGFPDFWDGDYFFYHYVDQAEKSGKYGTVLKARGKGYSFKAASMLNRNYTFFKQSKSFALAADTEYLTTDGLLNKAWDIFSFITAHTGFAKRLVLIDKTMHKMSGYKKTGEAGVFGFRSEMIGVTLKNDPDKARGKRGKLILWEEGGCHIKGTKVIMYDGTCKNVEDVIIGDMLMGPDSKSRKVLELHTGIDDMYRIKPKNGLEQIVNSKHAIYVKHLKHYKGEKPVYKTITPKEYLEEIKVYPKRKYNYSLVRPDGVDFDKREVSIPPYLLGLWLGDGDSDRTRIGNTDIEVINYLQRYAKETNVECQITDIKDTDCKRVYLESPKLKKYLKELNVLDNKHIPDDYIYTDRQSRLELLAGLIDSDGSHSSEKKSIEITQHSKRKQIIDKVAFIARSLGMKVSRDKRISKERFFRGRLIEGGQTQYRITILYGHSKIPCLIPRKQSEDREGFFNDSLSTRFDVIFYGVDSYYGFTLDRDHLFLTEDFTITHNSFPHILKSWRLAQKSLEDGKRVFGFMLAFGTGGEEGVDFIGLESLFYNSKAYRVYEVDNVWDKGASKSRCAFFVPDYLNRADCYDKDGNSDVVKAVAEVIEKRLEVKYNSNDATDFAQVKAEEPFTPQEAVMRTEGTVFPVADLKEYISTVEPNREHFIGQHYIGELAWKGSDHVKFTPKFDISPIRDWPYKGKDKSGAIEFFELPKVDSNSSKPPWGRYIGGIDPVDDDEGTSLFSVEIFDLFTDTQVAEWTGRLHRADLNFEIALKLAVFYNAELNYENKLKGLFAYFERMNALRYLADTPAILKDMDYVKHVHATGNKAHPYSQHVYTPKGKKLWGNIRVGDKLFDSTGGSCTVIDIPFDEVTNVYKVELRDGRFVYTTGNHLWGVLKYQNTSDIIVTTSNMQNSLYRSKGKYKEYKYYIAKNQGVDFEYRPIVLDPYTLGLLLGDGSFSKVKGNTIHFSSNLKDLETYKTIVPYEFTNPSDDRHMFIRIPKIKYIAEDLKLQGTKSDTKFVPDIYKYNTRSIRMEILRGLMDTDGSVDGAGIPNIVTVSTQLKDDILYLCRSLGYNCNYFKRKSFYTYKGKRLQGKDVYKINVFTTDTIFGLDRKNNKISKSITGRASSKRNKTAIKSITFSHVEKAKCVTVDSKDSCYLIGDFVKTHNSKGTPPTQTINSWGRRLQADWMMSKSEYQEDTLNLQRIRSIGYLKEAIQWNIDGNFDRISRSNMTFILRAAKLKYVDVNKNKPKEEVDAFAGDSFFSDNPFMPIASMF